MMLRQLSVVVLLAAVAAANAADAPVESLKPVSSFASIADRTERSVALFKEASRVIQHPRCLNCHPADRTPTQGDDLHSHVPNMRADAEGHGPAGMPCNTCHQAQNTPTNVKPIETIPGHAHWSLAPLSMGWQGLSTGDICRQLKDPARNGNRNLQKIHDHMALDTLVGWAWHPGAGRKPAPGTQKAFGELIAAWIETGAACPAPEEKKLVTDNSLRNKALVQTKFDAWRSGTGNPFELLADDASWTIVGRSVASKTYQNREDFIREVIRPFNARMKSGLVPTVRNLYADGDTVIVFFDAEAPTIDGRTYRNTYAWFMDFRQEKIVRATAFFDSIEFNELWARVAPPKG